MSRAFLPSLTPVVDEGPADDQREERVVDPRAELVRFHRGAVVPARAEHR
jgi:hypothetical protein